MIYVQYYQKVCKHSPETTRHLRTEAALKASLDGSEKELG